jgi:DNA ligase (NAD+)
LIDRGFITSYADIYELEGKEVELLGLEMNQDQYEKEASGLLYITLEKALFALTEQIPFKQIQDFLTENTALPLFEKLREFQNYIRISKKKVPSNTGMVEYLISHLKDHSDLPKLEDYVPVAVVLEIFLGRRVDFETLIKASKTQGTVHGILLELGLDLPHELAERIKKLKANTFQEGVISNMMEGIKASKNQPFEKVLFALGIRNIGENTAQLLAKHFGTIDKLQEASNEQLLDINGVGETLVHSLREFFSQPENLQIIERLKSHGLKFEIENRESNQLGTSLAGKRILASGRLNRFKRDEIVDFVQAHGGQYIQTVSKNLDFIIEGEEMGPSKKEKALKLGVPLISEEEFLRMVGV